MAYTIKQLQDLEAAIAECVLEVEYDGRKVRYRSLDQMRSLRGEMQRDLGQANRGPSRRVAQHRRGT